jgi:prepilin-type N-terminal cleavage/methylation domain-containing protein
MHVGDRSTRARRLHGEAPLPDPLRDLPRLRRRCACSRYGLIPVDYRIRRAFSLVEMLVAVAIIAVLVLLGAAAVPALQEKGERADALAKMRTMGQAVLHYPADHGGRLPPLFPGQVLEFEPGRGGRIVTECAPYLGFTPPAERVLLTELMPRAYLRVRSPSDHATMRVYVMNAAVTNGGTVLQPFGRVAVGGQPPVGALPLAAMADAGRGLWMMTMADQQQSNVATAPWRTSTPATPPLGDRRAVFRFDGSADMMEVARP